MVRRVWRADEDAQMVWRPQLACPMTGIMSITSLHLLRGLGNHAYAQITVRSVGAGSIIACAQEACTKE